MDIYKCSSCEMILDEDDLTIDEGMDGKIFCESCCPNCGTWLDDDDII